MNLIWVILHDSQVWYEGISEEDCEFNCPQHNDRFIVCQVSEDYPNQQKEQQRAELEFLNEEYN